ncbi:MAG: hypothetical protein GC138_06535 [Gammaproteobacteria bacterium]|nr:hypothetical protein [Gammaproteobacteria bacterium]
MAAAHYRHAALGVGRIPKDVLGEPTETGNGGRDVKGLVKFVAKFYSQKQLERCLDTFKRCAVFRGLTIH